MNESAMMIAIVPPPITARLMLNAFLCLAKSSRRVLKTYIMVHENYQKGPRTARSFSLTLLALMGILMLEVGPLAQFGRAPQWHCGGHRFDPGTVHDKSYDLWRKLIYSEGQSHQIVLFLFCYVD